MHTTQRVFLLFFNTVSMKSLKIIGAQNQLPIRFSTALKRKDILKVRKPNSHNCIYDLYYT